MRVAVFGTGPVGQVLTKGLAVRNHMVTIGSRRPEDPEVAQRFAGFSGIALGSHRQAALDAEFAVFALPFATLRAVAAELAVALPEGVTVLDASVPEGRDAQGRRSYCLSMKTPVGSCCSGWYLRCMWSRL